MQVSHLPRLRFARHPHDEHIPELKEEHVFKHFFEYFASSKLEEEEGAVASLSDAKTVLFLQQVQEEDVVGVKDSDAVSDSTTSRHSEHSQLPDDVP